MSDIPPKAPGAVLDYAVDWSDWLADGEIITASTWTIEPAGLTRVDDDFSDTAATIWVSGGTAGNRYALTNHITTSQGREDERTIAFPVAKR